MIRLLRVALLAALLGARVLLPAPGAANPPLVPGDHRRALMIGDQERSYLLHVPPEHDPAKPVPVVLALHGAGMNARSMARFCGLNETADRAGFIVAYPNGTGLGPFLTWNAGGFPRATTGPRPDDVAFIRQLLEDLSALTQVDRERVYACGLSNGAMMCYRLAAELSDRIAAIAPVAGVVAIAKSAPERPVPVIHFHGTADRLVPFTARAGHAGPFPRLNGVEDSIQTWVQLNGCDNEPTVDTLSDPADEFQVRRYRYADGEDGAEVVLVVIEGGGHTWPGQEPTVRFLGRSATNISANALIWDFFQRHPMNHP